MIDGGNFNQAPAKGVMIVLEGGQLFVKASAELKRDDILKMILTAAHVVALSPPEESRIVRPDIKVVS